MDIAEAAADAAAAPVSVSVARTGGVAGIRREWRIDVDDDGRADWILRIDACPWSGEETSGADASSTGTSGADTSTSETSAADSAAAARGADRMSWQIEARTGTDAHRAQLTEPLTGAWRELVVRVQREGEVVPARRALPDEDRPVKRRPVEPRGGA
ncbi:hypothetical protein [Schumannella sp. 10F1B-5-1]|uniref:hypothetical protein n=1 Tax=Schumannella sp. 10F1B-5-1 TaxID=2590780 RepID=UPI0011321EE6|nr:hypothetical protein [Schumannella sp. 10F1B-5-1]TPW73772.1 hypothetical protein FJ658_03900 [Schumannella sp. 10F1B-5-1]